MFWQSFVYKNHPSAYYQCHRLGHSNDGCRFPHVDPFSNSSDCPLQQKNFMADSGDGRCPSSSTWMVVEGSGGSNLGNVGGGRLRLGSWLVISRI